MSHASAELIAEADEAFLSMSQQINHLLDNINFYLERFIDEKDSANYRDLESTIKPLGSIPCSLAEVLKRWRTGVPRTLSVLGVEVSLLNELWVNIDGSTNVLIKKGVELHPFNIMKARNAFHNMVKINQLIK